MDYSEYAKRRLRAEERMAILKLDMLSRSFGGAVDALEKKLEGVKGVKRDLGMMRHIITRFMEEALKEVPADQVAQLLRQSRDYRLSLERLNVNAHHDEYVIGQEDVWQMIHITLDARCSICLASGTEAKNCGVRKLLRKYMDEPDPGCLSGCGYAGVDVADSKLMNRQERL
jgi:hypothetical protein